MLKKFHDLINTISKKIKHHDFFGFGLNHEFNQTTLVTSE